MNILPMRFLLFCWGMLFCIVTMGQTERKDPDASYTLEGHSPRKATLLSAVLPGAGQVYNNKYWKVPLIYGGAATFVFFIDFNNRKYQKYSTLYEKKVNGTISERWANVSDESLRRERENWRRNRDLNYIGIGALYFLQIIDANVDAHLYAYDISDDLTFRYEPDFNQIVYNPASAEISNAPGIKLTLIF